MLFSKKNKTKDEYLGELVEESKSPTGKDSTKEFEEKIIAPKKDKHDLKLEMLEKKLERESAEYEKIKKISDLQKKREQIKIDRFRNSTGGKVLMNVAGNIKKKVGSEEFRNEALNYRNNVMSGWGGFGNISNQSSSGLDAFGTSFVKKPTKMQKAVKRKMQKAVKRKSQPQQKQQKPYNPLNEWSL